MNKEHWNTIILDNSLDDDLVKKLIYDSYVLVVKGLPQKEQKRLGEL